MSDRSTPFDLVFGPIAEERFPPIRIGLEEAVRDALDRSAFLLDRRAAELVHELEPEDGLGRGVEKLAALVHHAFLFWHDGSRVYQLSRESLAEMVAKDASASSAPPHPAFYLQVPLRLVWAQLGEGAPHEPLDGFFAFQPVTGTLAVLGIFGFHRERLGLSVVEVQGPTPGHSLREDGHPSFSPVMTGGDRAGLYSLAGEAELLSFAHRALSHVGKDREPIMGQS